MSSKVGLISEVKFMASVMDQIHKTSHSLFNNKNMLRMSLEAYLERIQQYSECHEGCFVIAMILIDRVMETNVEPTKSLPFNIYT